MSIAGNVPVVYQLRVQGQQVVLQALDQVDESVAKSTKTTQVQADAHIEAYKRRQKALKEIEDAAVGGSQRIQLGYGDAFKKISRDIDTVAGDGASKFAKMADDVAGVAEALGGGGVLGATALVSAGVGILVGVVSQWKKEEEDAKKAAEAARIAEREWLKETSGLIRQRTEEQKARNAETIRYEVLAHDARIRGLQDAKSSLDDLIHAHAGNTNEIIALTKEAARITQQIEETKSAKAIATAEYEAKRKKETHTESNKEEAAQSQEAADKVNALLEKRRQMAEDDLNAREKGDAREAAAAEERRARLESEINEANQKRESEKDAAHDALDAASAEDAKAEAIRAVVEAKERDNIQTQQNNKDDAAAAKVVDDMAEAEKKHRLALQAKNAELQKNVTTTVTASAVNLAYTATLTAITPAVNELSDAIGTLTMVNRENYAEMLFQGQETPKLIAYKTQAILSGIAKEAFAKSIFESGETVRETALALGSIAIGDGAGASLHTASAAAHVAAANVYAIMGGGAGAAAIGIGFTRGNGELVGLTREEREANDRKRGGSTSSTGFGRSSESSRSDTGPIIFQQIYEAGSISTDQPERAARAVASAWQTGSQSAWIRRQRGDQP